MTNINSNLANKYKEGQLGTKFCRDNISQIRQLIGSSTSFSVVGLPAMGISKFLKYLSTRAFAYFVHIDINELQSLSSKDLFELILKQLDSKDLKNTKSFSDLVKNCASRLRTIIESRAKVVLVFDRFDRLHNEFSESFFGNLRVLRDVDQEKIVMIFAANRPLVEQAPAALSRGNLNMYSKNYYLKPYLEDDLKILLKINSPKLASDKATLKLALKLSGGHYQLFQLLLKSDLLDSNPLTDPAVYLQIKQLWEYLNFNRKKQMQKIALKGKVKDVDNYLLDIGYVKKDQLGQYQIFTPLLSDYIKDNAQIKLPVKESKLFALLKSKQGRLVPKDEIFQEIWSQNEEATDWALNALIYRLRKNPTFLASGYVIESRKKIGYSLVKNN